MEEILQMVEAILKYDDQMFSLVRKDLEKTVSETLLQSPLFLSYFKTNLAHHLRKYYLDDSMLSLKGVPEEMLLVGFPDSFDL